MKKRLFAFVLMACMALTGCSESAITENKIERQTFDEKCEKFFSFMNTAQFDFDYAESSAKYDDLDNSVSKIYVVSSPENNGEERILVAFLDIFTDDEYQYFQCVKDFISFIDDNLVEISGRSECPYQVSVNSTINDDGLGYIDISISCDTNRANVIYGNRAIKLAYSDRINNMGIFEKINEIIAVKGLLNFAELPEDTVSYDITVNRTGIEHTHKWYTMQDGEDTVFATYIDDGTYQEITDDELIVYAYNSIFDTQNKLNKYDTYYFYIAKQTGEPICRIEFWTSVPNLSTVTWSNGYEHLNDDPYNQQHLEVLKNVSTE